MIYAHCHHCLSDCRVDHARPCSATCGGSAELPSKPPSSPVETTAGSERRPDHTGVIRPTDGREARYAVALCEAEHCDCLTSIYRTSGALFVHGAGAQAVMALADAEHGQLWKVIRANGDTNARLMRERDEARAALTNERTEVERLRRRADACPDERALTEHDATIERLWAQLNEATNVPGAEPAPVDVCPCSRCAHYRDVAASVAAKAKP